MRNATELRDEILAAARAEFSQYGLAGARIDRIIRSARASKERLYAHFGDKESLFREVVAAGNAEFFRAVSLRPDAVEQFVAGVYDLARQHPEHHRMITWARLEGITLDEPLDGERPVFAGHVETIETAQAEGYVDPAWNPVELLVLLFGVGLAWANSPHPDAVTAQGDVADRQRAAAIDAARRIIAPGR